MGWSESCKRHPSLKRSPGVCPACLRERLSLLSRSTAPSDSASSGGASPARGHQRHASEVNYPVKNTGFVPRCYSHRFGIYEVNHEHHHNYNNKNHKKNGFWSKLISGKRSNKNNPTSLLRSRLPFDSIIS